MSSYGTHIRHYQVNGHRPVDRDAHDLGDDAAAGVDGLGKAKLLEYKCVIKLGHQELFRYPRGAKIFQMELQVLR